MLRLGHILYPMRDLAQSKRFSIAQIDLRTGSYFARGPGAACGASRVAHACLVVTRRNRRWSYQVRTCVLHEIQCSQTSWLQKVSHVMRPVPTSSFDLYVVSKTKGHP